MPERPHQQLVEDAEVLRMWLHSEYYPAFQRMLDDALEDARTRVLTAPVKSLEDVYALLEAKGRHVGLLEAGRLVHIRINEGAKARDRLRGGDR